MKIAEMHWHEVEDYLKIDDRAVVPLGCTEQHAFLSLATDSILAERIALEAAEPLGVPVFPVLPYGITAGFTTYPGTVSLRVETFGRILTDVLGSLTAQGFRRILLVNGHGGNAPANAFAQEWMQDHPQTVVRLHNWWNAPKTAAEVQRIDPVASHASWMENFPWTRLEGVSQPTAQKPLVDFDRLRAQAPAQQRAYLGDGNFGGYYQRSDEDMQSVWQMGVLETRAMIEGPWA